MTVKSEGTYDIRNIKGYDAEDKFFQINAPCTFSVTNAIIDNAGTMLRQNGDAFTIHVSFDQCDISNIKLGSFRNDSSTSTAQIFNSELTNAGKLCIGNWASCGYVDGSNPDSDLADTDDSDDTDDTDEDTGGDTGSTGFEPAFWADLIVAADGSGDYRSVQNAVKAAPSGLNSWYTSYIKYGKYRELLTVPSDKTYIQLLDQSVEGTVITYNNYASLVGSTSGSATAVPISKTASFRDTPILFSATAPPCLTDARSIRDSKTAGASAPPAHWHPPTTA